MLAAPFVTTLPPPWLLGIAAATALFALRHFALRWAGVFTLGLCWALFQYADRLDRRLDPALTGQLAQVRGVVSSVPSEYDSFVRFRIVREAEGPTDGLPTSILAYWYRDWPKLAPGQRWVFELTLKPPWGRVNFQGGDREGWLFAEGVGALATVSVGRRIAAAEAVDVPIASARGFVQRRIEESLPDGREQAVVRALATADRSGLSGEDRRLLQATGTSHLLAISGLHIGLAAAGGMWLGRLPLLLLPAHSLRGFDMMLPLLGGMAGATTYAALAGFGTPTLRAVLMLFVVLAAVIGFRIIHPARAWAVSLAILLVVDPFAPLGAGFWFSFLAVGALLVFFLPRNGPRSWWDSLLAAQWTVLLTLLPVGAYWFQWFSPSAFAANLAAIPWVSFLVVPPVLGGMLLLPVSETAAGALWSLAGFAVAGLFLFLEGLDRLQGQFPLLAPPSGLQAGLAVAGACVMLLPRGVPARWLGAFLVLPLLLPPGERTPAGTLEVEVLDAGQGTAVVVSSGGRSLLYDSGPGDGAGRDLVAGVIAPALARHGRAGPQEVVISHGDLDHAGGLHSLRSTYPNATYRSNMSGGAGVGCLAPDRWDWPGVSFRVLHPSPGLPYLGNDSSCVISVRAGQTGLLLPGDISTQVESRLLADGLGKHGVVLVPHHGSRTSSGVPFLRRLNPDYAIATAGLGNRFDFPRPGIRRRYAEQGASFWSTGDCGALRLRIGPDGQVEARSARKQRNRAWRWPAAGNCP